MRIQRSFTGEKTCFPEFLGVSSVAHQFPALYRGFKTARVLRGSGSGGGKTREFTAGIGTAVLKTAQLFQVLLPMLTRSGAPLTPPNRAGEAAEPSREPEGGSSLTHPLMVNLTTARREPAALSSGWNSVSLAITFTPAMAAGRRRWRCRVRDVQRHGGQDARHAPLRDERRRGRPRSAPAPLRSRLSRFPPFSGRARGGGAAILGRAGRGAR